MIERQQEMIKAFQMIYKEEKILNVMGNDKMIFINTKNGIYRVEYNNGNCITTYMG